MSHKTTHEIIRVQLVNVDNKKVIASDNKI